MPLRCIHRRSLRMPSLVTFPFIQCHHTLGLAALEGFWNSLYKLLFGVAFFPCEKAEIDKDNADTIPAAIKVTLRFFINLFWTCCHIKFLKEIFLKSKGLASSFGNSY